MGIRLLLPDGAGFSAALGSRAVDAAAAAGSVLLVDFSRADCVTSESAALTPTNLVAGPAEVLVGAPVPGTDVAVDASAGRITPGGGLLVRSGINNEVEMGLALHDHFLATQHDVAVSFWLRSYLADAVGPAQTTANHRVLNWGTTPSAAAFVYQYQAVNGQPFPDTVTGYNAALAQPGLDVLATDTGLHHVVVSSTAAYLDGVLVATQAKEAWPDFDKGIEVGQTFNDASLPADVMALYRVHVEDLTASGRTVADHVAAERALVTRYHPMISAE